MDKQSKEELEKLSGPTVIKNSEDTIGGTMKPLTILMITAFPCIRALKESCALKLRGHTILLLCNVLSNNKGWDECASGIYMYHDDAELVTLLSVLVSKVDLVHCHNEPNTHVALTRKVVVNIPVIYDCHDFTSMYLDTGKHGLIVEKYCFEECDAVIHVSNKLCRQADAVYNQKKSIVLYSFPSLKSMPFVPRPHVSGHHVAYEGGLTHDLSSDFNYRYYLPYFQALAQNEIHVHVYPAEKTHLATRDAYTLGEERHIHLNPTLEYKELLHHLSSSTWGLTGFYRLPDETSLKALYLDNAMPNKLFEYLYVGLTPIVINCKEAARFVTEHNVGYAVDSMEEFVEVVKTAPPLAQGMDLSLIDMDVQIEKLEDLYCELLGLPT